MFLMAQVKNYIYNGRASFVVETLEEAAKDYENVYHLRLDQRGYTKVPKSIQRMTNLVSLDLSGNAIEDLGTSLKGLTQLEVLKLNGNQLKNIPLESLSDCTLLKELYLKSNQITGIDTNINQFKYLTKLDVGDNQINSIDAEIYLPRLKSFKAEHNKLDECPSFLQQSPKLGYLNLRANQIPSIEHLANLTKLISLNVGDNPIESIRPILQLSNLEFLIIDWINLSAENWDNFAVNLKWLRVLSAEHCQLTKVPSWIESLKHLEELSLIMNDINQLPAFLYTKKRLKKIWLGYNPVAKEALGKLQESLKRCTVYGSPANH